MISRLPLHLYYMNRLKGILYELVAWLARLGPRKKDPVPKLLIIRLDEIGDYLLWRPFIHELLDAERFKGYRFHFCGNQSWKSLFNQYDQMGFETIWWMDKIRFKKDLLYRYRFLKECYKQQYICIINPTFSRDKRYDDSIVKAASAKIRMGMVANLESIKTYEKGYDSHLYNHLFDHPERPLFEFLRNKLFTEFITEKKSNQLNTRIDHSLIPAYTEALPHNYFIVFPGSRSRMRIWPTESFIAVSNFLFEQYGWTAIVCGTQADEVYTESFCGQYYHPYINLTGKTSLVEMLAVMHKASCLLTVDTGSVHLAVAAGCPVFGAFNGSQYGRFAPYPSEVTTDCYALYPDTVEKDLTNPMLVKEKYEFVVRIPYSLVKPEKMILAIHHHFSSTSD